MPYRALRLRTPDGDDVSAGLARVREELGVPERFPDPVLAEAAQASTSPRRRDGEVDARDLPLVTVDPPGSMDLDQAVHLERRDGGYRVHYAIADVAAFVRPRGAVDAEAHRRGLTLYAPDVPTPLHPTVLSEAAASLLPGADRPAVLWRIDLDGDGEPDTVEVRRALVRSRARLDYGTLQGELDAGRAAEPLALLRELGVLRELRERDRGAVSLPIPEQVVEPDGARWRLDHRAPLPVEGWNAQVSLLTGMAAARLMVEGGVGVLRTLPGVDPRSLARLRRVAAALGVAWPAGTSYPELVRSLDPAVPAHAAVLDEATTLLRGAGYRAFDGEVPADAGHAAIAAHYAHATAPLRRLVDRYVSETCLALSAGRDVPGWVRDALPGLPAQMTAADRFAATYERACIELVEAVLLAGRRDEVFAGVVVDVDEARGRGEVHLSEPAVRGRIDGAGLPLGERIAVRVAEVSVATRTVRFVPA